MRKDDKQAVHICSCCGDMVEDESELVPTLVRGRIEYICRECDGIFEQWKEDAGKETA